MLQGSEKSSLDFGFLLRRLSVRESIADNQRKFTERGLVRFCRPVSVRFNGLFARSPQLICGRVGERCRDRRDGVLYIPSKNFKIRLNS